MKPRARQSDLVVQNVGSELLVYDSRCARAILLSELCLQVWKLCDGLTEVPDICSRLPDEVDESSVWVVIGQLEDHGLLEAEAPVEAVVDDVSRREALKQLMAGAALAVPSILSVAVPLPAAAASCIALNNVCVFSNFAQSNCCPNLRCDQLFPDRCRPCFNTGTSFGSGGTIAACNALATKNLCCNSAGTPTLGVGNACLCP